MTSVVSLIRHYQRDIEKCAENETRVLRCLSKLHQLGVTVQHLQDTGVGRTVNALRKEPGEVGVAARALVAKWKHMVASAEQSSEEEDDAHHSGRDSAEDSDQNVRPSRDVGQEYVSDHETGEFNIKFGNEPDGSRDPSTKRYHESEEDESKKRTKYNQETGNESELEEALTKNQVEMHQEDDEIEKHVEIDDNGYPSDSTVDDEKYPTMKDKPKFDDEKKQKNKSHPSNDRRQHKHASAKQENSSKHKSESRHRSEKDSKKHSSIEEKEKKKDKESRDTSESKESKRSRKNENNSEKSKRTEKNSTCEDRSHKSVDRHNLSEKTDRSSSKDKHSSSSKSHKSSKHKESEDESNHKEKSRERASSSSHKESSKEHSKSSSYKDKVENRDTAQINVERGNKENKVIEKHHNGDYSSKAKHSDQSSSHSHKNRSEKSSNSDSKHKSSRSSSERKSEKSSSSSKQKSSSSFTTSSETKSEKPKKKTNSNINNVDNDDGIGCESGASFAEALGMVSPVKSKKKKDVDLSAPPNNSSTASTSNGGFTVPASLLAPSTKLEPLQPLEISALPEISPNYKPRPPPRLLPQANDEEEALSFVMSNKNQRTKVFSGNKTYGKVLSLYELCVNVLQEHIDALEYTGGVPYEILKPVVDRANPDQLFALEHFNPYLMDDTNHLWQQHCEKKFRTKKRHEMETWREMYLRCLEEQEARLKSLTANIKMAQDARNAPTKQTKMAYVDTMVKPPRNIARKQAIHGTARAAVTSPAARVAALAGAGVVKAGVLPPRPSPLSNAPSSSSSVFKPKKAPLMQKALQFMRGRKR